MISTQIQTDTIKYNNNINWDGEEHLPFGDPQGDQAQLLVPYPILSYDMQTGKYYLESGESNKQFIHKIGKLQNKFRPDGSGVWNTKKRLQFVKENPENEIHRHYVPDQVYHQSKSFYTPIPRKFNGYAQRPRSFKDDGLPSHLKSQTPLSRKAKHPSHSTLNKKSTI